MTATAHEREQARVAIGMATECIKLIAVGSAAAAPGDPLGAAATMLSAMQFMVAKALGDLGVPPAVFMERVEATMRVFEQQQKASAS